MRNSQISSNNLSVYGKLKDENTFSSIKKSTTRLEPSVDHFNKL